MEDRTENIRPITAEETYSLRHRISRPNQTLADCQFPLDKAPDTYHAGYFLNGELVGVGTVSREAEDGSTDKNIWRIWGMAVATHVQGQGIGSKILVALISYAASRGLPGQMWCRGRVTAANLYKRFGFLQVGDAFDLSPLGPHLLFRRKLQPEDLSA